MNASSFSFNKTYSFSLKRKTYLNVYFYLVLFSDACAKTIDARRRKTS